MKHRVSRTAVAILTALILLTLTPSHSSAEEGKAVKLEFIPIYTLTAEEAIEECYANLEKLGIDISAVTITTLENVYGRIAVQSTQDVIDIVKQIMNTIDPPPPPPPRPREVQEILDNITVKNLSPVELGYKLDEVMVTFMNFTRLDPGAENFFVFARDTDGTNSITFYIPNIDEVNQMFFERKQGYTGYQVYIRTTDREKQAVAQIKGMIATVDMPLGGKEYKAIPLYYIEVAEAINSLKALGYYAIDTSSEAGKIADEVRSGVSPVIYTAPSVKVQSVTLSTNFGSGSSRDIRAGTFTTLRFTDPVATSDIHRLIIYGSLEEIEAVEEFLKLIDVPARQIMIDAQVIEINIDDLTDLGLKEIAGVDDIIRGNISSLFPGEGAEGAESNMFIYDDDGSPAGSFNVAIQALIQDGKATIMARPKVVTVDGRQAIISIGRQVPVVQETQTSSDRSVFEITFVPVGITLNIKPRIGAGAREVQMEVDAVVSNVETINNVNVSASLRAPELNTREVHTIVRIPNHHSLILGGLISTESERRTFKVPLLGDLPLIGGLFRRSKTAEVRTEIIIVITPHIAEEVEPRSYEDDPNPFLIDDIMFRPIGSEVFDALNNILLPSTYLIKQTDIQGMDLGSLEPLVPRDQIVMHSIDDPVLLTLRGIVRKLDMVDKLKMLGAPAPKWMSGEQQRYNAEAFLVLYLEQVNNLTMDDLIPGWQIIVPSNPDSEGGFESTTSLWNSINFEQLTQRYTLMQPVVKSLMILDGKEPPEEFGDDDSEVKNELPETGEVFYGPMKVGLLAEDGSHKLVGFSFGIMPVDGKAPGLLENRRNDIEALALAIISEVPFEELTSVDGAGGVVARLAAAINELLEMEIVGEINFDQSATETE